MSHNSQVKELLSRVNAITDRASVEKDFEPAFAELRTFEKNVGPIKFENGFKWSLAVAIAAVGGTFSWAFFSRPDLLGNVGENGVWIVAAFAVALIGVLWMIGSANSSITKLSDRIFMADVFMDNQLEALDIGGQQVRLFDQYSAEFGEFRNRGDEDREIISRVRGQWNGEQGALTYELYTFRYVRVYYVPVPVSNGKTTTIVMQRRTETLYRFGALCDFPYGKGMAVTGGGGVYNYPASFETASDDFNRSFKVMADEEMTAAKFLKPTVVLAVLEIARSFSGVNIEISRTGRMNIAFSDSNVLSLERKHSIAQPDAFAAEIGSRLELKKLEQLLRFVDTLKKHNDSNF